jgi:hypothetical protein
VATELLLGVFRQETVTLIVLWCLEDRHCAGIDIGSSTTVKNRSLQLCLVAILTAICVAVA